MTGLGSLKKEENVLPPIVKKPVEIENLPDQLILPSKPSNKGQDRYSRTEKQKVRVSKETLRSSVKTEGSVQVMDFQTSGSQANRSLTLRFHAAVVEGACCDASGVDTGTRVVQICAVAASDASDCVVS